MKKIKFLLFGLLITSCFILLSCSSDPFDLIHKGTTYEKIVYYMGTPDEEELLGEGDGLTYKALYWFSGASSKEEATENFNNDIPVTYQCIIVTSKDGTHWKVNSNDDIVSGVWGVE